ncbi:hypothetical protein BH23CHL5_BH23CHL5_09060 [soil metagenome]
MNARAWLPRLLLLAILVGIPGLVLQSNRAVAAFDQRGPMYAVYVLPDDGRQPFIDEIDASTSSIELYLYLLSDQLTIDALVRAHVRGVRVRVMLEPVPFGGARTELETFNILSSLGVDVRWSPKLFRFSHVKMAIFDDSVALIMNLNVTESAFASNRDFAILSDDVEVVASALEIFEADWLGQKPPDTTPPAGPLVVSPHNSRTALLSLIESATLTLDLYSEFITDPEIIDSLIAAAQRGVLVRLVMSEASEESLASEEPGSLARNGVIVRIVNAPYIHAKAIIADGNALFIGSQNFTSNSLDNNREVGLIVNDPAAIARVSRAFETDFTNGTRLVI